ncbi:hypothetical protein ACJX0J_027108 [Zea mays]
MHPCPCMHNFLQLPTKIDSSLAIEYSIIGSISYYTIEHISGCLVLGAISTHAHLGILISIPIKHFFNCSAYLIELYKFDLNQGCKCSHLAIGTTLQESKLGAFLGLKGHGTIESIYRINFII